jgi:hypothetical protein
MWNKIPLAEQATSGNLRLQQKAVHEGNCPSVLGVEKFYSLSLLVYQEKFST